MNVARFSLVGAMSQWWKCIRLTFLPYVTRAVSTFVRDPARRSPTNKKSGFFRSDESAFRTMTAFHRLVQQGADWGAELVLIDVGPNLGAINRSALIASDQVCLPLAPDLFSLQGLKNLGPTLREWRAV